LNPVAAGVAATPEASEHTSIKARVDHVVSNGRAEDLQAAELGSVAAVRVSGGLEDELWLVPVEDRRGLGAVRWRDAEWVYVGPIRDVGGVHRPDAA